MPPAPSWTADDVGRRLIAAFTPDTPIWSSGRRFTVEGVELSALGWLDRYVVELRDRRLVATWASCRASGIPFAQRLDGFGWLKKTSRRRCKAALAAIAAGLNASERGDMAA